MRRAFRNAADAQRTGGFWIEWVADIVAQHLPGSPARRVQVLIVEREGNVAEQRWNRAKTLEQIRKLRRIGRFRRNFDNLRDVPRIVRAVPKPNRTRQILERYDYTRETIGLVGIVRWTQFENH